MARHHRSKRLLKEDYDNLIRFKDLIKEERSDKFIKDKRGRIYRLDKNGVIHKVSIEEVTKYMNSTEE